MVKNNPVSNNERMPNYGGQALIEGVMMRGSLAVAAAMRSPDGSIVIQSEKLGGIYQSKIKKVPFLRGLIALWDALGLGMRFLTRSANVQSGENEKIEGPALYLTVIFSLVIGIGIFFALPSVIGQGLDTLFQWNIFWGNLVEGLVRLFIAIGYIWAIGFMPDIRRVFSYHGAEHKTINAFEAGAELKPEIIAQYSIQHPRCGTSFLLTLILLSIIVFSPLRPLPFLLRISCQLLLIPILAGISYEYIRWMANHLSSRFVRLLIKPNLALQKLSTREPSLDMIEVAVASFDAMRNLEKEYSNPETPFPEKE
jgi:uncharacterized protein YqhQ